jgi:diketogulonate reductase-like aldo/keto reductase
MKYNIKRREAIKLIGCAAATSLITPSLYAINSNTIMKRTIPSSGEKLPVIGLGTWQTFDVGNNKEKREPLLDVLKTMKRLGGAMIDSSPMYASSETVVGDLTQELGIENSFFYATKVWTEGKNNGVSQMNASFNKMQRKTMDLMQIHNLVDWQTHIKTLRDWKEEGKIRYFGFTHYTNSSHDTLAKLIKQERPDFVQFNYSINERNAEQQLLNVAKDNGTAVIINRPYDGGNLFRSVKGKEIPVWCKDLDINSWGQYFLKYIISHKAVNCVIPGTSKAKHAEDNMKAGYGILPNNKERLQMLNYLKAL